METKAMVQDFSGDVNAEDFAKGKLFQRADEISCDHGYSKWCLHLTWPRPKSYCFHDININKETIWPAAILKLKTTRSTPLRQSSIRTYF